MSHDGEMVGREIDNLARGIANIESQVLDLALNSNGGITFFEASQMSYYLRAKALGIIIKRNDRENGREML